MLKRGKVVGENIIKNMKSATAESIVLNVMYTGTFLNENMGHEVINLFKDDQNSHYLYLNPYGNFSKEHKGKVKAMLMVMPVPKRNMFEVIAIATGLEDVFEPTDGFNASLDKSKYTETNLKAYDKVHQCQLDYIKNNKVTYGGVALDELFANNQQQAIYITYKAGKVIIPEKRIFITFQDTRELGNENDDECIYVHLTSCKQCKMSQKQYVRADDFSKEDWDELKTKVLDYTNLHYANQIPNVKELIIRRTNRPIQDIDSIFEICGIADNELAFSNALAYYIEKYPSLFNNIFGIKQLRVAVQREYEHIDIFVKDGDRRIIIENKIHSGIIIKGNTSQLDRYWEQASLHDDLNNDNVTGYIVCPEYAKSRIDTEKNKCKYGAKYKVISYKEIWETLKGAKQRCDDGNFNIFVEALHKHAYRSIAEINYEKMKNTFLNRIQQNSIKKQ